MVVSDTSPINYLILTEYVAVLHELYGQIVIPGKVFDELSSTGLPRWSERGAPRRRIGST